MTKNQEGHLKTCFLRSECEWRLTQDEEPLSWPLAEGGWAVQPLSESIHTGHLRLSLQEACLGPTFSLRSQILVWGQDDSFPPAGFPSSAAGQHPSLVLASYGPRTVGFPGSDGCGALALAACCGGHVSPCLSFSICPGTRGGAPWELALPGRGTGRSRA